MAMAKGRKGTRQVIGKAAIMLELKYHILRNLHKLSDRDTQQLASQELERTAQNLTPEGIALFLACLYDTDAQQKSIMRSECIRLVGTLALFYGDLMACHLPKMVGNIIRRLKDPDSNIRDACVETIGILASQIRGANPGFASNIFVKLLLEALAEQHQNLQIGASMCLARVIESMKDPHPMILQRLCPRIVKMLASPNFLAKASLLNVVGVVVQVPGVVSISQLHIFLNSAKEELENNEWTVRKAAADTLSCIATIAGVALGSYGAIVITALENIRFDKVKPVRDSVSEALELWKLIYNPNEPQVAIPSKSHKAMSPTHLYDRRTTSPSNDHKNNLQTKCDCSIYSSFFDVGGRPNSTCDKCANMSKNRTSVFSNKDANLDFFCKHKGVKDSINWHVDIAIPHDTLHERSPRDCGDTNNENLVHQDNCIDILPKCTPLANDASEFFCPNEDNGRCLHYDQEKFEQLNQPQENEEISNNEYQENECQNIIPKELLEELAKCEDTQSNEPHFNKCGLQWDANVSSLNDVDKVTIDMVSIHTLFYSLEQQQLSLMETLQDSMMRVHESMQCLEKRVSRLEHIVENMTYNSSNGEGKSAIDESQYFQSGYANKSHISSDEHSEGKMSENNIVPSSEQSQNSLELIPKDLDEFSFVKCDHQMSIPKLLKRPSVMESSKFLESTKDILAKQMETRRVCDQDGEWLPHGEGPSAHGIWHASKEEAIATIRSAAFLSKPYNYRRHANQDSNIDQKLHRVAGGPFWMLWNQAMENVQLGSLDIAYSKILGSNDELLLVRLMDCTGPVLEQLRTTTIFQLLNCIIQFLQQQSFLDCIIPWLQQVLDIVSNKVSNMIGQLGDINDITFALQEATNMDYAQSWMGAKIAKLAKQFKEAWSCQNSI